MADEYTGYDTAGHVQPDGSLSEAQIVTPVVTIPAQVGQVVELLTSASELLPENTEHQAARTFVLAALQLLQS